jgi:hypothetical protein
MIGRSAMKRLIASVLVKGLLGAVATNPTNRKVCVGAIWLITSILC